LPPASECRSSKVVTAQRVVLQLLHASLNLFVVKNHSEPLLWSRRAPWRELELLRAPGVLALGSGPGAPRHPQHPRPRAPVQQRGWQEASPGMDNTLQQPAARRAASSWLLGKYRYRNRAILISEGKAQSGGLRAGEAPAVEAHTTLEVQALRKAEAQGMAAP